MPALSHDELAEVRQPLSLKMCCGIGYRKERERHTLAPGTRVQDSCRKVQHLAHSTCFTAV